MRALSSLLLAGAALLGGCATVPDDGPVLAGSEWRFTAIDNAAPTGAATLSFDGERLAAYAGCNRIAGSWRIEAGTLIAGPLIATKMFCEGKMDQERAVGELLEGKPRVTLAGDRLSLEGATHSAELERTR